MEVEIEHDLRDLFGPARDQGARPTCMAFAASDAHAAVRVGWEPLSCEFAYYHALQIDGGEPHEGATAYGMLKAIKSEGQPPETVWEYLPQIPADKTAWKPPANATPLYKRASAHDSASLPAIKELLGAGCPVIITMSLSDGFYVPDGDGVIAVEEPPDSTRHHAVVAVGYGTRGSERMYLVRNSWGIMWGIDGYAWISEGYLAPRLSGFAELKEDLTNVSANKTAEIVRSGMG
ncbi:C1 family peptidase [Parvibaculum sp.]|uniref:C1 family peptidase n=1 Tax=Parvibaculum sp. TaxID=2024848 RepID=UPI000C357CF0|nr:C1 family peptidase [Parvibaculum sp.]MAM93243.1 peptidase C1 [Parvibaculum sp.]|tara:strand:+ start:3979 stop:4680 length:702 start_codon:yes stop_codon:yes gene_type:complete